MRVFSRIVGPVDNALMHSFLPATLDALMKERRLSAAALADRCPVTQPTISRILSGKVLNPKRQTIEQLAKALGVETGVLFKPYGPAAQAEDVKGRYEVAPPPQVRELLALFSQAPRPVRGAIETILRCFARQPDTATVTDDDIPVTLDLFTATPEYQQYEHSQREHNHKRDGQRMRPKKATTKGA